MRPRNTHRPSASRLWQALLGGLAAVAVILGLATVVGAATTTSVSIEGEAMAIPTAGITQVGDRNASGMAALAFWSRRTATAVVNGNLRAITVRVRGTQCNGAPQLSIVVDGAMTAVRDAASTTWTNYTVQVPQGGNDHKHVVSISFTNDSYSDTCDRNLFLDRIVAQVDADTAASTTPTTSKPVEADTLAIVPSSAGTNREDITASGETSALIWDDGYISAKTTDPISTITARVKGEQCAGAPRAVLSIDGNAVGEFDVYWSGWATIQVDLREILPPGPHTYGVRFTNNATNGANCDRNLAVDWVGVNLPASYLRPPPREAETLVANPTSAGGNLNDSTASSYKTKILWNNGNIGMKTNTGVWNVVVKLRGDQCGGAPIATIAIDGTVYSTFEVFWSSWATVPLKLVTPLAAGLHTITVNYTNDSISSSCDRNLRIDWVGLNVDGSYLGKAPTKPANTNVPPVTNTPTPSPPASSSGPGGVLRWAPPKLTNPVTLNLGTGETYTQLDDSTDYIINFPKTFKAATTLKGGRNIVVMGGLLRRPAGATLDRALFIDGAVGTVHIEGVEIDNTGQPEGDGIAIRAPKATVQIQNTRIVGITGSEAGEHGDIVQPWGGVAKLRIDHMSGSTNYQGLFLRPDVGPIGTIELSNIDLNYNNIAPTEGGDLLWLTTDCRTAPTTISNVYIGEPMKWLTRPTSVWPKPWDDNCPSKTNAASTSLTWPSLPVTGSVTLGKPSAGAFVPAANAGAYYTSPGYN